MSGARRQRPLTAEERQLWAHVARAVTPLKGRLVPAELCEPVVPPPDPVPPPPPAPLRPRGPAAAAGLERRTRTALKRGTLSIDAVLDLHGKRQAEAHAALIGFLQRSQRAGHGIVLVVTGKGAAGTADSLFEERGVLRRVVPHWLRGPELRAVVSGFEEATHRHGGAGALYVRLRRSRGRG